MSYFEHLSKDKKFSPLLADAIPFVLKKRNNISLYLIGSIMSQQLSVKVAAILYKRFLALYGNKEPTAAQIMETSNETLRAIGLSNAKVSYVKNVAAFHLSHGIEKRKLRQMEDEAIIEYLTQIKGVGRWTVEMLLMSALGRPDVFAIDDWGIQNAMIKLYKLDRTDKKKFRERLYKISGKWSPYRSYACKHLWAWKDNTPME